MRTILSDRDLSVTSPQALSLFGDPKLSKASDDVNRYKMFGDIHFMKGGYSGLKDVDGRPAYGSLYHPEIGEIQVDKKDPRKIKNVAIREMLRGKGVGKEMYLQYLDKLPKDKKGLRSDFLVSDAASNIYKSLDKATQLNVVKNIFSAPMVFQAPYMPGDAGRQEINVKGRINYTAQPIYKVDKKIVNEKTVQKVIRNLNNLSKGYVPLKYHRPLMLATNTVLGASVLGLPIATIVKHNQLQKEIAKNEKIPTLKGIGRYRDQASLQRYNDEGKSRPDLLTDRALANRYQFLKHFHSRKYKKQRENFQKYQNATNFVLPAAFFGLGALPHIQKGLPPSAVRLAYPLGGMLGLGLGAIGRTMDKTEQKRLNAERRRRLKNMDQKYREQLLGE